MTTLNRAGEGVFTVEGRPSFQPEQAAALVREHFAIEGTLTTLPAEWDQNFRLEDANGRCFVIKFANASASESLLDFQNQAMSRLSKRGRTGVVPTVLPSSSGTSMVEVEGKARLRHHLRVLDWIDGTPMSAVDSRDAMMLETIGVALGELDGGLDGFTHPAMNRHLRWDLRQGQWISAFTSRIPDTARRGIVERMLLQFRGRMTPLLDELSMSVIHNDANDENILLSEGEDGEWRVSGLLDFGDMVHTHTVNELAIAGAYAILGHDDPLAILAALTRGYHSSRPLSEKELRCVFPLMCLRLCISVTNSAMAAKDDPENTHRLTTDGPAWEMLEQLEAIEWNEAANTLLVVCGYEPSTRMNDSDATALAKRQALVGSSLSLAYDKPLQIVKGRGQFLFEPDGTAHLDCVNNVCHIGHSHPRVVQAMASQAATLNTNTRYLHPLLAEYAGRLTDLLPDPLNVCFFVNSGSEANELAIRLARTYTNRRDVIVLDHAYHGSTQTLVEMSPYKCEGPGEMGLPEWVHKVEMPDPYRGTFRGRDEETGKKYAALVGEMCAKLKAEDQAPALFIAEPILGCGGQVVPPDGYLRLAFDHVRAAGGVCIADEVQVGMGRSGTHLLVCEAMGAVPDIVTLGKPIGSGHPLGAVITTHEIADAFANGMEYFSTFGGNPVSMAVGLAVLDVIEEEGLMQHARKVGQYMTDRFTDLGERHSLIGDVRGLGLFMGVELVLDRDTLEPATEETTRLIEFVKADGILLSAEGPHHNVLKIKPPMVFDETDADLLVGAVDRGLQAICR